MSRQGIHRTRIAPWVRHLGGAALAGLLLALMWTAACAQSAYERLRAGSTADADTVSASSLDLTNFPSPAPADLGGMLLKLGLAMVVVLAIIVVMQRLARRWGRNLGGVGGGDDIRVLAQRALGPRVTLMVVETLGQRFLIGMSPQGVHRVAELGDVDLFQDEQPPAGTASIGAASMGAVSSRPATLGVVDGGQAPMAQATVSPPVAGTRDEATIGFAAQLRERLHNLRGDGE